MDFDAIKRSLSSLSYPELKELKALVNYNLDFKEKSIGNPFIRSQLLVFCAKYVAIPYNITTDSSNKILDQAANELDIIARKYTLSRIESMKLCSVIVSCAVDRINTYGKDISFRYLLNNLLDPTSLLDESFPGYVGSRLFKSVVLNIKS